MVALGSDDLARDDIVRQGVLAIKLLRADGLSDQSRFGALDIYVKFSLSCPERTVVAFSSVARNAGRCPEWRDGRLVHLPVDPSMSLAAIQLACYASDRFDDDLLCEGSVTLREVTEHRQLTELCVPVSQPGGTISLELAFYPTHPEYLFFIGGKSHEWESCAGLVERYDPVADAWSAEPAALPSQDRDAAAAANLNGQIYVAGGMTPKPSALVERYDTLRDRWERVAPMQQARHGLALVGVGGCLYALGGSTDMQGNGSTAVERYDPQSDEWTACAPMCTERRKGCAAVSLDDGCVYVVGGEEMDIDAVPARREVTGSFERLDPVTGRWTQLAQMPTARGSLAAAALDGKIYAAGGQGAGEGNTDTAVYDTVERYDPETDCWERVAPLCAARSKLCLVVVGGRMYAVGGYRYVTDEARDEFFSAVEVYDPVHDGWQAVSPMTVPRCLGCATFGSL